MVNLEEKYEFCTYAFGHLVPSWGGNYAHIPLLSDILKDLSVGFEKVPYGKHFDFTVISTL